MGLMKKLTSAIVASSLVFTLVGSASAAYTAETGTAAATRMQALKIVQGMPDGTLGLDQEITRAQLVTIIVRAFGQEENAKLLQGSAAGFTDTANHWASGNIAMAKALVEKVGGDAMGFADGSFQPEGKLTPAQAVAFLMKFLGVKADPAKAWPANYLDKAADMGLIAADDKAAIAGQANTNATRGLAFYLFDRAFASYTLPSGKTFYTQYVDQTAPELTVKNEAVSTTMDASVTVTGTVTGASELYVGSTKVTPDASGNFSADVALGEVKADPYVITVTARDLAGNKTEKSIQVTRTVGTAASIEASDITVAAGATADVAVAVKDAKGNVLAGQTVTGTSTIGTFADGKFTAAKTVGTGKLTLTVGTLTKDVNVTITAGALASVEAAAASVQPGKSTTLVAKDANGNTLTGVTFSQSSADALLDSTTGTFIATKAGVYTVKATKDGVTVEGKVNVFGDVAKLVVVAPDKMVANEETEGTITVQAVDTNGNVVTTFDNEVKVAATGLTFDDDQLKAVNGVATFKATADADSANTEVEISAQWDNNDSGTITADDKTYTGNVSVDAQVATSLKVTAPTYLPTNSRTASQNVTVDVLDQNGESMLEGAWQVHVALTGPATLSDTDNTTSDDIGITPDANTVAIYPNEAGEAGTVTVAVSFTGMTAAQATMKAAYAQEAKSLVMSTSETSATVDAATDALADEKYVEYTVKLVDKNGVPTTEDADLTLKFTNVPDKELVYLSTQDRTVTPNTWSDFEPLNDGTDDLVIALGAVDGVAKFRVAGEIAGTFQVQAKDTAADGLTASSTGDIVLKAGSAANIGLTKGTLNVLRKDSTNVTLTAQLFDAYGNKVAKSGVAVTFANADYDGVKIAGAGEDYDTETDANGVATAVVTLANYVDTAVITAVSDADGITEAVVAGTTYDTGSKAYGQTSINFQTVVPGSIAVEIVADDTATANRLTSWKATDAAGQGVYLRATVKDNFGRAMEDVDTTYGFSVTNTDADFDTTAVAWTDLGDGVYVSDLIQPTKAETLGLTVTVKKMVDTVANTKSIVVKPGDVDHATIVEASDNVLAVTADKVAPFTVVLVDKFGNNVTSSQVTSAYKVALTSADNTASFRNADGKNLQYVTVAQGRTTATFYYIASDDTADITLSFWVDANSNDTIDVGETSAAHTVDAQ